QGTQVKDVIIKPDAPNTLLLDKHADYIAAYSSKKDDYEYTLSEYLRMSGIYWGLTVIHWIDKAKLRNFILACQDEETGGFADRPGDMLISLCSTFLPVLYISIQVDPFHTLFGVAGLSLLGDEQIKPVNPVFCMPEDVLQRIGLQPDLLS
uniref:Geranylgeranyl transferase type II subunit beta n=1 Tax=Sinocyclocheilus anshuiensis TaxID=1608454 RepID=A0A671Q5T7_9TELE